MGFAAAKFTTFVVFVCFFVLDSLVLVANIPMNGVDVVNREREAAGDQWHSYNKTGDVVERIVKIV